MVVYIYQVGDYIERLPKIRLQFSRFLSLLDSLISMVRTYFPFPCALFCLHFCDRQKLTFYFIP